MGHYGKSFRTVLSSHIVYYVVLTIDPVHEIPDGMLHNLQKVDI